MPAWCWYNPPKRGSLTYSVKDYLIYKIKRNGIESYECDLPQVTIERNMHTILIKFRWGKAKIVAERFESYIELREPDEIDIQNFIDGAIGPRFF